MNSSLSNAQVKMLGRCKLNGWDDVRGPRWRTAEKLVDLGLVEWHRSSTGGIIGVALTKAGREVARVAS